MNHVARWWTDWADLINYTLLICPSFISKCASATLCDWMQTKTQLSVHNQVIFTWKTLSYTKLYNFGIHFIPVSSYSYPRLHIPGYHEFFEAKRHLRMILCIRIKQWSKSLKIVIWFKEYFYRIALERCPIAQSIVLPRRLCSAFFSLLSITYIII